MLFIVQSSWMVVFDGDKPVKLVLMKGCWKFSGAGKDSRSMRKRKVINKTRSRRPVAYVPVSRDSNTSAHRLHNLLTMIQCQDRVTRCQPYRRERPLWVKSGHCQASHRRRAYPCSYPYSDARSGCTRVDTDVSAWINGTKERYVFRQR